VLRVLLAATVRVYKESGMSGPVATDDAAPVPGAAHQVAGPVVELSPARLTQVGSLPVRRVLPQRPRRTVGSWCFLDHAGPVRAEPGVSFGIGPHPHMGLQTVTWLLAGELLHLDSLGSEQLIRPGQLNLMTAGHGVAHAEEDPARAEEVHAVQLWVAQPEGTRDGPAAFEHHAELPRLDLGHGEATVLVGAFAGAESPARRDTAHMGAELVLRGPRTVVPLRVDEEYALVVLQGRVTIDGVAVEPGVLAYLGLGRDECALDTDAPTRALLLGGVPFPEPILMWWNFVGRTRGEISEARRQWSADDGRFGRVRSSLERIGVGAPPWE
jgi:redox-sensitive bicupin YhaK (pirin superfamily)